MEYKNITPSTYWHMHTLPITLPLLVSLLVVCMPRAYGLASYYGLDEHPLVDEKDVNSIDKHRKALEKEVYVYNFTHVETASSIRLNSDKLYSRVASYKPLQQKLFKHMRKTLRYCSKNKLKITELRSDEELDNVLLKDKNLRNDMLYWTPTEALEEDKVVKDEILRIKTLSNIYETAMQLYNAEAVDDLFKSYLALCELKGKMGQHQQWDFLLVRGYAREVNEKNKPAIYIPRALFPLIENFLTHNYQAVEKQVLIWVVHEGVDYIHRWAFITEWLEAGIDNQALCRDIDYLRKYDIDTYTSKKHYYMHIDTILTYGNNFSNKRLLQWLIHEKQWPVPTDVHIAKYSTHSLDLVRTDKMRCIQLLKEGNESAYDLQVMKIMGEDKSNKMPKIATKFIGKKPFSFAPFSDLSMVCWTYMKQVWNPCNGV